jgi:Arc/MetJ-type ribon-helix-helix transcriptional regulator
MRSVMVQLSEDQITRLDVEAARKGVSRSSVVRAAVDGSLKSRFDQAIADQYAQAYPDGTFGVDEWGSLDEWHAAAAKSRAQSHPKEAGNNTEPGNDTW